MATISLQAEGRVVTMTSPEDYDDLVQVRDRAYHDGFDDAARHFTTDLDMLQLELTQRNDDLGTIRAIAKSALNSFDGASYYEALVSIRRVVG